MICSSSGSVTETVQGNLIGLYEPQRRAADRIHFRFRVVGGTRDSDRLAVKLGPDVAEPIIGQPQGLKRIAPGGAGPALGPMKSIPVRVTV